MKIETIFGHKIVRISCTDETVYRNEDLSRSVTDILNLPSTLNRIRGTKEDCLVGDGLTTVGQSYIDVAFLPGSNSLTKWITEQMQQSKSIFEIDKPGTRIEYKRSWANRVFKGSKGKCHCHWQYNTQQNIDSKPDIVALFYVDVPENSSKLVICNNGRENTLDTDYLEKDKYYISPSEGELILHSPEVWHAVSEHQNDLPRNVLVFDAIFV